MRLLVLVLAAWATFAAACPSVSGSSPSFGTGNQNSNKTLERRWTDAVTDINSVMKRWPRGADGFTTINFCWPEPIHRSRLYNLVMAGITVWMNAIGAAGQANRHSLVIQEHQPAYCYYARDPNDPNAPWIWNPAVPGDTLMIMIDDRVGSATASLGWHDESVETRSNIAPEGRHTLRIDSAVIRKFATGQGSDYRNAKASVAHEFGHVLGLDHEQ